MSNEISIPPLITLPKPEGNWDECGGVHHFCKIRKIHSSTYEIFQRNYTTFSLHNENPITIFKNSSQTVDFPVLFITSLPAFCVLICDFDLNTVRNLFSNITVVPTNDTYPQITLFNNTKNNITLPPDYLKVNCQIVPAKDLQHNFEL